MLKNQWTCLTTIKYITVIMVLVRLVNIWRIQVYIIQSFSQNFLTKSKIPWLFPKIPWPSPKFPDFSLNLNFPDFSLTSGYPVEGLKFETTITRRIFSYVKYYFWVTQYIFSAIFLTFQIFSWLSLFAGIPQWSPRSIIVLYCINLFRTWNMEITSNKLNSNLVETSHGC